MTTLAARTATAHQARYGDAYGAGQPVAVSEHGRRAYVSSTRLMLLSYEPTTAVADVVYLERRQASSTSSAGRRRLTRAPAGVVYLERRQASSTSSASRRRVSRGIIVLSLWRGVIACRNHRSEPLGRGVLGSLLAQGAPARSFRAGRANFGFPKQGAQGAHPRPPGGEVNHDGRR